MKANQPSNAEFIALVAVLTSMVAFSTDAMLPALPELGADLRLANVNHAQLVVSVFIVGTGCGQLISGPLSDAYGRKPVLCIGLILFLASCYWAFEADSFASLLAARFVQGLGVSAPRTVTMAMVRDLHSGRAMARVVSFALMLFVLVPAVAPYIGQSIMLGLGWRYIFVAFQMVALVTVLWLVIRQPETLATDGRIRFRPSAILGAVGEVFSMRRVVTCTITLTLSYTCIFAYLVTAQQAYVDWLGAGHDFPFYFALVALFAGSAGFLNAVLVGRYGMRRLASIGLFSMFLLSAVTAYVVFADFLSGKILLWSFVGWSAGIFFLLGLCLANLNALALEPVGHIAGTASSIIGAVSTILCLAIAVPIGQLFDGTGFPLIAGVAVCSGLAFVLNVTMPLQPHLKPTGEQ